MYEIAILAPAAVEGVWDHGVVFSFGAGRGAQVV